jgi:hypothetical protein
MRGSRSPGVTIGMMVLLLYLALGAYKSWQLVPVALIGVVFLVAGIRQTYGDKKGKGR